MYKKWKDHGLKNEDARFVLPNACTTEIIISANFREFRHIFKMRCSPTPVENREACMIMLKELKQACAECVRRCDESVRKKQVIRGKEEISNIEHSISNDQVPKKA